MEISIRRAVKEDISAMFRLVKELAEFERAPEAVVNTEQMLLEDGFGADAIYKAFVADADGAIVGMALYYTAYSTWKGKIFFLDDIVVTEQFRGFGVGKKLIDNVLNEAHRAGANQIRWQVLEWNTPAIEFYKKVGMELDPEWINCRMSKEEISNYVENLKMKK